MGTSSPFSGSGSDTSLLPTWIDEPFPDVLPCSDKPDDGVEDGDEITPPDDKGDKPKPPIIPAPQPNRFRSARTNFSRFAGSGGSNQSALKRAVRDYVRHGTNGSATAVKRMNISSIAASKALGILRGIERDGVQKTLRSLNLQKFEGRDVQDMFIGLTESICTDGGTMDEAISRSAWLETIAELGQLGISDLGSLSFDEIKETFLSFISHTIEKRLHLEIGVNGFKYTENMKDIDEVDRQFRDYISGSVKDSFKSDLEKISQMSDKDIRNIVDKTYLDVWNLLESLGDREG